MEEDKKIFIGFSLVVGFIFIILWFLIPDYGFENHNYLGNYCVKLLYNFDSLEESEKNLVALEKMCSKEAYEDLTTKYPYTTLINNDSPKSSMRILNNVSNMDTGYTEFVINESNTFSLIYHIKKNKINSVELIEVSGTTVEEW